MSWVAAQSTARTNGAAIAREGTHLAPGWSELSKLSFPVAVAFCPIRFGACCDLTDRYMAKFPACSLSYPRSFTRWFEAAEAPRVSPKSRHPDGMFDVSGGWSVRLDLTHWLAWLYFSAWLQRVATAQERTVLVVRSAECC